MMDNIQRPIFLFLLLSLLPFLEFLRACHYFSNTVYFLKNFRFYLSSV